MTKAACRDAAGSWEHLWRPGLWVTHSYWSCHGGEGEGEDFPAGGLLLAPTSLPSALLWGVGWVLRIVTMVFTNGYGGHRKNPGLAVRNFDLILLGDFGGKPFLKYGPQFPHSWNAKAGLGATMDASSLILSHSSFVWKEGCWGVLWPELCPLSSYVNILTLRTSAWGCVWR